MMMLVKQIAANFASAILLIAQINSASGFEDGCYAVIDPIMMTFNITSRTTPFSHDMCSGACSSLRQNALMPGINGFGLFPDSLRCACLSSDDFSRIKFIASDSSVCFRSNRNLNKDGYIDVRNLIPSSQAGVSHLSTELLSTCVSKEDEASIPIAGEDLVISSPNEWTDFRVCYHTCLHHKPAEYSYIRSSTRECICMKSKDKMSSAKSVSPDGQKTSCVYAIDRLDDYNNHAGSWKIYGFLLIIIASSATLICCCTSLCWKKRREYARDRKELREMKVEVVPGASSETRLPPSAPSFSPMAFRTRRSIIFNGTSSTGDISAPPPLDAIQKSDQFETVDLDSPPSYRSTDSPTMRAH